MFQRLARYEPFFAITPFARSFTNDSLVSYSNHVETCYVGRGLPTEPKEHVSLCQTPNSFGGLTAQRLPIIE